MTTMERPDLKQLLIDLAAPSTRERSAQTMLEELKKLARMAIKQTSDDDRDECIQIVAIKLFTMSEKGEVSQITGWSYATAMLKNAFVDICRQRARIVELPEMLPDQTSHKEGQISQEAALQALFSKLEALKTSALRLRSEKHRAKSERDIDQLFALALGTKTMEQLIAEAEAPGDAATRKKVVDRLLQRHKRARDLLEKSIEKLEDTKQISPDEAQERRQLCRLFLRRQSEKAEHQRSKNEDEDFIG